MPESIYDFEGLKNLLRQLGYAVLERTAYQAIDVADVTLEEVNSGAIEFTNEGIFVTANGVRRQVFLYKRDYHLRTLGKPKAHIVKCETINNFSYGNDVPLYRRANTNRVQVRNMDNWYQDMTIEDLPICKHCLKMLNASPFTTSHFVQTLQNANNGDHATDDVEVDLFGYTSDWEDISRAFRSTHNYTCEQCGLHITDLYDQHHIHVHHRNGRKTDNREANLQCLCLRCHANVDNNHKQKLTGSSAQRIIYDEFCRKYPERKRQEPPVIDDDLPF